MDAILFGKTMVKALEGKFAGNKESLSLSKNAFPPISMETADAARAILEKDNFYLLVGDRMNDLFFDISLSKPCGWDSLSQHTLAMLYLVTIFQFIEGQPDDQAVEALQARVDWKYALHLPLSSSGFGAPLFCKFRQWLLADQKGVQTLQTLLLRLSEIARVSGKERFSMDAEETLRGVCLSTRLSMVWIAIRKVLEVLTTQYPGWLRYGHVSHCYSHYASHGLALDQSEIAEQEALAHTMGMNGFYLLKIIAESTITDLSKRPEVVSMRAVWEEQYEWVEGHLRWRKDACASCRLSDTEPRQTESANHDR